jgi:hypothetical protein
MQNNDLISRKAFSAWVTELAFNNTKHIDFAIRVVEKLADFPAVDAVILPCKLGDPVYIIRECSCHVYGQWNNPNPRKKCSGKVYLGKKQRAYHCGYVTEAKFELKHIADFGKLVFLTREEAEAALAKMDK